MLPPSSFEPLPQHEQKSEWRKFIAGFSYAFSGFWYTVRTQRNMRVHVLAAIVAVGAGIYLHISAIEFALIFIAITGVFITEMINTVLEVCVDLASPTYHPLAKIAKDVAAGAVLVNAILSVIIGLFIFLPHLLALF
ncbi:diacylglycerol kinase family protein [Tengunoibacter tsumagoiensis]|uniref:Diacylglycerol kinase n=1 Tax=Tengunoibacter tsumagoiensis TaxID=2014871 RepID=A0A401ZY44_9CHLR|nr:diacylglycerol kinase [Tengunoibacter tsumagoiensis]